MKHVKVDRKAYCEGYRAGELGQNTNPSPPDSTEAWSWNNGYQRGRAKSFEDWPSDAIPSSQAQRRRPVSLELLAIFLILLPFGLAWLGLLPYYREDPRKICLKVPLNRLKACLDQSPIDTLPSIAKPMPALPKPMPALPPIAKPMPALPNASAAEGRPLASQPGGLSRLRIKPPPTAKKTSSGKQKKKPR
jgi:hypothetical protein